MTKIDNSEMMLIAGGAVSEETYNEVMATSCGLAISGAAVGGFGFLVTGLLFGPTCLGMAISSWVG